MNPEEQEQAVVPLSPLSVGQHSASANGEHFGVTDAVNVAPPAAPLPNVGVSVSISGDKVLLRFERPVDLLTMDAEGAVKLGGLLLQAAHTVTTSIIPAAAGKKRRRGAGPY